MQNSQITFLFSPKPFIGQDAINQNNAIASWKRVAPEAQLICYGTGEGIEEACNRWSAIWISNAPVTTTGAPRFDWIVSHAAQHAKGDLQIFINADIFLLPGFTQAIKNINLEQFLGVSDRFNLKEQILTEEPLDDCKNRLAKLVHTKECSFNGGGGSDFFIFKRGLWTGLPPIAVGRACYDNSLMAFCLQKNIPLVDMTNAVACLHAPHGYDHVKGGKNEAYKGIDVKRNETLLQGAPRPVLCDASYLLTPEGLIRNKRIAGLPHRLLVHSYLTPRSTGLARFSSRVLHFITNRLGLFRPRPWQESEVLKHLDI